MFAASPGELSIASHTVLYRRSLIFELSTEAPLDDVRTLSTDCIWSRLNPKALHGFIRVTGSY